MKLLLMKLKMALSKLINPRTHSSTSPRRTRSYFRQEESMIGLLSVIEPATVDEALSDDGWILAMQE
jgi:hypothetical protein